MNQEKLSLGKNNVSSCPHPGQWKRIVLACVLIISFLAFSPSLFNAIDVWDDDAHLANNKEVLALTGDSLSRIFHQDVCKTYVPLTILSFAIEHHFFGFNPVVYHLDNLILHLAVVALAFCLGLRLGLSIWAAGLAALIFGIHPMHVESVAWTTERKDVLYSFFYLLALLQHGRYLETRRVRHYVFCLIFGLLSILSKAMALSLPFVLLVYDWYADARKGWRGYVEKIPFLFYIIPIVWITYSLNARLPGQDFVESVLICIWSFVFYIQKFFFPVVLSPYYAFPTPVLLSNGPFLFSVIFLLVLLGLIYRFRREKMFVFAVLYYLASIFILLRYDAAIPTNIVADRFMYLPSLGICWALGVYIERLFFYTKKMSLWIHRFFIALCLVIFLFLAVKSFIQTMVWRDSFSLWTYVLKYNDKIDIAQQSAGQVYFKRGEVDKALSHYQEALRINPNLEKAHNNVGDILFARGQEESALNHFRRAVEIKPDYAEAQSNYGTVLTKKGDFGLARKHIKRAIEIEPDNMIYFINLGDVDLAEGNYEAARQQYRWVLTRDPENARVFNRLGVIALKEEKSDEAIHNFQQAIRIDPNYTNARNNLNETLMRKR